MEMIKRYAGILMMLTLLVGFTSCEDDESVYVQLDCGNDYGYVIGRRGETLDAIQYLTRLVINKGKDNYKRVSINAGNYREKREVTLRELAKKNAARVKKYGRNVCLDPMNPYERRIIHSALQNDKYVMTRSEGENPFRHVVISLKKEVPAGNGRKERYGSRRDNRGRGRNAENKAPKAEAAAEKKEAAVKEAEA